MFVEAKIFTWKYILWRKPKEWGTWRCGGGRCGRWRCLRSRKGWLRVCVPSLLWRNGSYMLDSQVVPSVLSAPSLPATIFFLPLPNFGSVNLAWELDLDFIPWEILSCSVLAAASQSGRSPIAMISVRTAASQCGPLSSCYSKALTLRCLQHSGTELKSASWRAGRNENPQTWLVVWNCIALCKGSTSLWKSNCTY